MLSFEERCVKHRGLVNKTRRANTNLYPPFCAVPRTIARPSSAPEGGKKHQARHGGRGVVQLASHSPHGRGQARSQSFAIAVRAVGTDEPPRGTCKSYKACTRQCTAARLTRGLVSLRRSAFQGNRFYKKADSTKFPKHFQIGTVVEGKAEWYSSRIARKDRRGTLAEEILSDPHLAADRQRRYDKLQAERKQWHKRGSGDKPSRLPHPRTKRAKH